jgi:hypothetical protein
VGKVISCTSCGDFKSCTKLCHPIKAAIKPQWSTYLRETAVGSYVEQTPSSQAHIPDNTPFPTFDDQLRPVEAKILEYYYQDGYSYEKIAEKLCKKQSYIKITMQRAKAKIKNSYDSIS